MEDILVDWWILLGLILANLLGFMIARRATYQLVEWDGIGLFFMADLGTPTGWSLGMLDPVAETWDALPYKHRAIPSGYVKIAIENGPVEIVDLPSYKMVIFHGYVSLPEGNQQKIISHQAWKYGDEDIGDMHQVFHVKPTGDVEPGWLLQVAAQSNLDSWALRKKTYKLGYPFGKWTHGSNGHL